MCGVCVCVCVACVCVCVCVYGNDGDHVGGRVMYVADSFSCLFVGHDRTGKAACRSIAGPNESAAAWRSTSAWRGHYLHNILYSYAMLIQ